MTEHERAAFMLTVSAALNFREAGDALATMLGYSLAAMEVGEAFDSTRLEAARQGIVAWRQLKLQAGPTLGGK